MDEPAKGSAAMSMEPRPVQLERGERPPNRSTIGPGTER
jgi:hypothetical protein